MVDNFHHKQKMVTSYAQILMMLFGQLFSVLKQYDKIRSLLLKKYKK